MKRKIIKGIIIFTCIFFALFIIRLIYSIFTPEESYQNNSYNYLYSNENQKFYIHNYASEHREIYSETDLAQNIIVDHKYEKVATIYAESSTFKESEEQIYNKIEEYNGIIQFENRSGIEDGQQINLIIGIHPDHFELFIRELQDNLNVIDIHIEKRDKTNEYNNLLASRLSLEKTRDALMALKSQPGRIDELIELEYKILEIEKEIQNYGVSLGEFDEENEFCTVSLYLDNDASEAINLIKIVFNSFLWSLQTYVLSLLMILMAGLCSLIVVIIVEKCKKLYGSLFLKEKDISKK